MDTTTIIGITIGFVINNILIFLYLRYFRDNNLTSRIDELDKFMSRMAVEGQVPAEPAPIDKRELWSRASSGQLVIYMRGKTQVTLTKYPISDNYVFAITTPAGVSYRVTHYIQSFDQFRAIAKLIEAKIDAQNYKGWERFEITYRLPQPTPVKTNMTSEQLKDSGLVEDEVDGKVYGETNYKDCIIFWRRRLLNNKISFEVTDAKGVLLVGKEFDDFNEGVAYCKKFIDGLLADYATFKGSRSTIKPIGDIRRELVNDLSDRTIHGVFHENPVRDVEKEVSYSDASRVIPYRGYDILFIKLREDTYFFNVCKDKKILRKFEWQPVKSTNSMQGLELTQKEIDDMIKKEADAIEPGDVVYQPYHDMIGIVKEVLPSGESALVQYYEGGINVACTPIFSLTLISKGDFRDA